MIKTLKKIWLILSYKERQRALLLLCMMTGMALLETIGVSSIMPFLAVMGDPQSITTNKYLAFFYKYFDFKSTKTFLIALGVGSLLLLSISSLFKTVTFYASYRFANMRRHSIGQKLLQNYLHQPYSFFLTRNSSDVSNIIISETDILVNNVLNPVLKLLSYGFVAGVLIILLVIVDPKLAIIQTVCFGGFYIFLYLTIRKYLARIGKERAIANAQRFKISSEILGGVKDIKILGRENVYLNSFKQPSTLFSAHSATSQTLTQVPQYFVEVIAFGSILLIALYAIIQDKNIGTLLPVLGLYAFGALKLKPALSNMYSAMSSMKFGAAALDLIIDDLKREMPTVYCSNDKMKLTDKIVLNKLSFKYDSSSEYVLKDISLEIKANTTVGIIGTTGSGKSTLMDIVLGLLVPTEGGILIDGIPLSAMNMRSWQNSIGYVSQDIFLIDCSIAENIAFGMSKECIDIDRVINAAKMAKIHEFILELDNGYDTEVGERGVRLSGGQKQRLGIARALYHDPSVLIFDEATSALDNQTESEVMASIESMSGQKTIIMIAHRLTTVEKCDQIIKLEKGCLSF